MQCMMGILVNLCGTQCDHIHSCSLYQQHLVLVSAVRCIRQLDSRHLDIAAGLSQQVQQSCLDKTFVPAGGN